MSTILGAPTEEFDCNELRRLLYEAKTREELQLAIVYFSGYFARGKIGVFKWAPDFKIFEHYNRKDACDSFIHNEVVEINHDGSIEEFKLQNWFFKETPFFGIDVDTTKPRSYRKPCGAYVINNFPGFLHSNPPPFYQFSKEIRDQVKLILNHMREVLCSSDKKQELYMMGLALRIAIGQKMQKTMFLYSGPGTGKTMLTWFLRNMVLGPKITTKTADERVITGQFNKELEGKVLLVLEEMSNAKSTDWITFANRLKDFIDSDIIEIKEKFKTPREVTNITNLIISSNNSKTIRLDKNDRRYFIPDISEKYVKNGIGMDHYYAPLDKAIKDPEVGKAFYSYALEYVRLNPNFNERKIPMSKTKLMMTSRDVKPVHEFIKQEYICKSSDLDLASSYLYNAYKFWFQANFDIKKRPQIMQDFTRDMGELGLKPKSKRVGDRKANKKMQWYSASYNDLYKVFREKNMIDEAENINEPEGYQHTENTDLSLSSPEIFPAEEAPPTNSTISITEANEEANEAPPINSTTSITEANDDGVYESSLESEDDVEVYESSPESEDDCDGEVYESSGDESESEIAKKRSKSSVAKPESDDDNEVYESSGDEMDDEPISEVKKPDPKPVTKEVPSNEESNKAEESKQTPNDEDNESPQDDENPQDDETQEPEEKSTESEKSPDADDHESTPEPIIYKVDTYEKIFEQAGYTWKICGYDIDDFDWECFIQEIEEHITSKKREDSSWYRFIDEAVGKCHYYLADKKTKSTGIEYPQVSDSEIIKDLSSYGDKRLIAYVPTFGEYASNYIVPSTSSQSLNKEEKCEDSEDQENFSDDADDDWFQEVQKFQEKKIDTKN